MNRFYSQLSVKNGIKIESFTSVRLYMCGCAKFMVPQLVHTNRHTKYDEMES